MMLPRPEGWLRPAPQRLLSVRWPRVAAALVLLLLLELSMMWLAPRAHGAEVPCRATPVGVAARPA